MSLVDSRLLREIKVHIVLVASTPNGSYAWTWEPNQELAEPSPSLPAAPAPAFFARLRARPLEGDRAGLRFAPACSSAILLLAARVPRADDEGGTAGKHMSLKHRETSAEHCIPTPAGTSFARIHRVLFDRSICGGWPSVLHTQQVLWMVPRDAATRNALTQPQSL